jgi:hypothetical protein
LVAFLVAAGVLDLVLPEPIARSDQIGRIVAESGIAVWVAPSAVVMPLRLAAAISTARSSAALLARLPGIPHFRAQLRRLEGPASDRQLRLI